MISAISPIDGRYHHKCKGLADYSSEMALIKYRVKVEIAYFKALVALELVQLKDFPAEKIKQLDQIQENFSHADAERIKSIERITNHDVKAVEYFLKEEFEALGLAEWKEFIHFGLTSQDINNTAFPMMLKDMLDNIINPALNEFIHQLETFSMELLNIPMLARTHGQAASPTRLGKEMLVFYERLKVQIDMLKTIQIKGKFGGATGNFNAHFVAYPNEDWIKFADIFLSEQLGINRSAYTTQIAHYDNMAAVFHACKRINTILIDFARDIWTYVSMDYFKQKIKKNEVGSSAMPHKVNPIDFENAEGNLGMANAIFNHLADKLPISRLQRDLTDSTVLRNIGVPFAHMLIALSSFEKGINKLLVNKDKISADLEENWLVISEAIQNILRREKVDAPYEQLKELTRNNEKVGEKELKEFIDNLDINEALKDELKAITPFNYIGILPRKAHI